MSYGTTRKFATKKALRDAVAAEGADSVGIFGTSAFSNETATTVGDLARANDTAAVIVGPDVNNDRRWYANVAVKKDGTIFIK